MKQSVVIAIVATALLLTSCANRFKSSILPERGVKGYEREYFLKKESYGVRPEIKESFSRGKMVEGMTEEMVRLLWGPPDRVFDGEGEEGNENVWEFVVTRGKDIGRIIATVTFGKTEMRSRAIGPERIVTEISGDRRGGLPEGMSLSDINK